MNSEDIRCGNTYSNGRGMLRRIVSFSLTRPEVTYEKPFAVGCGKMLFRCLTTTFAHWAHHEMKE